MSRLSKSEAGLRAVVLNDKTPVKNRLAALKTMAAPSVTFLRQIVSSGTHPKIVTLAAERLEELQRPIPDSPLTTAAPAETQPCENQVTGPDASERLARNTPEQDAVNGISPRLRAIVDMDISFFDGRDEEHTLGTEAPAEPPILSPKKLAELWPNYNLGHR